MADSAGILYGIGVGPGDPELITLKGLRLLRACPVIAYPAPENGDSLARRIVTPHLPGGQVEIPIRMPLLADRFPAQEVYAKAAAEISAHLAAGRDVAVLCLGDPFFYGSFMYLFARLAASHHVVVVPGITSVAAGAAALGEPLVARHETLAVIPASLPDPEIERHIGEADAIVFVKLGRHFARLRELLSRMGLAATARYIEHASMPSEQAPALSDIDPATVPYFSLVIARRSGIEP
jgi:precorrin-2/cobalt-factor-2 C20-methyltransferase